VQQASDGSTAVETHPQLDVWTLVYIGPELRRARHLGPGNQIELIPGELLHTSGLGFRPLIDPDPPR
jgi:hypothetical protein